MKGSEQRCAVHIGTSGWHYKHWLGSFYPANLRPKEMLSWYMERFDTVELNNSFYHLPARETFEGWRRATPVVLLLCGERKPVHYASQEVE